MRFDPQKQIEGVRRFVSHCATGRPGEFTMYIGGEVTLYASCFAAMILHYLGDLQGLLDADKCAWVDYLNTWQDPLTGLYIGPEICPDQMSGKRHDLEHVTMHLTAHVLPALSLLGGKPHNPLKFAEKFTNLEFLKSWLNKRDWKDAWLEGNNLLFVGQFLIYLRDFMGCEESSTSLQLYFDWLDNQLDPKTGLWGTNGYCNLYRAMYGGYHQLLVYYYEKRQILYKRQLLTSTLSVQHWDGGFASAGGGGACEDMDGVDILVNLYKLINFKHARVRHALRKALAQILKNQVADGGFVYHLNQPFTYMGLEKTHSPANVSNMFATWSRVHTIALIAEIITDDLLSEIEWQFNPVCSMGWHRQWNKAEHKLMRYDRLAEFFSYDSSRAKQDARRIYKWVRKNLRVV